MKKLLLIFSLILPLIFSGTSIVESKPLDLNNEGTNCSNPEDTIVRIINNYDVFRANGFVYKVDDKYTYIMTTSDIITGVNSYKIIYNSGSSKEANVLGTDEYNQVAILRTDKEVYPTVCFANSDYLYKGQQNYAYGYYNMKDKFYIKTNLSQIGVFYSKSGQINVFKNTIQISASEILRGSGVFDEKDRLIGMINAFPENFDGASYMTESNRLRKIADSIEKTGKYKINYIKYNLVDYNGLSSAIKKNYGVSKKATSGVVVTTFKPINYIFGGLNQGMVIVAVNGIEIKNKYEFDKQLARYQKNDNVCLKVINKSGKVAFYHVKV